ncbi:MAG TPA: carboxypeptidase regulatory-like domain-containing protein [Gemmataceae bacterium]|nr:carboxypeptidase regulatory-like domain-containing protein [Gemmataceae bacterium]
MHAWHWRLLLPAACALVLAGATRAQEARPLERKELDQRIYVTLRDVINRGADLYNPPTSDRAGCYRLYQGALMAVRPLLDHRPQLQQAIDQGLARAEGLSSPGERAFALREVLDRIRAEVKPSTPTLWERLGGKEGVTKVVDDFVATAASDPKVNFFRDGKYKLDAAQVATMKRQLVEMISAASGGPLKYTGRSMKEVHKGMGITDAEFDALLADLKAALESNGVKPDDVAAVLKAVEATRKDIVEKTDEKKPEEKKKEEEKKPEEKKKEEEKKVGEGVGVTGTVTLDGKPLADAVVQLVLPDDPKAAGYTGKTAADGKFEIKGVKPGSYEVRISKPDKKGEQIPARYNAKSALRVQVPGADSIIDFALQSR